MAPASIRAQDPALVLMGRGLHWPRIGPNGRTFATAAAAPGAARSSPRGWSYGIEVLLEAGPPHCDRVGAGRYSGLGPEASAILEVRGWMLCAKRRTTWTV